MTRFIAIALVAYSFFEIETNLSRLEEHFAAGPAGTGKVVVTSLWVLLLVQALGSGVFLAVPYLGKAFPSAIHFGWRRLSDYTPEQRERIMPLLKDMTGLMGVVFSLFFTASIRYQISNALAFRHQPPPAWMVAGLLAGEAVVVVYYLWRIGEAAKGE